eukprot:3115721-Lingulodinium_polyedra.AAC.1
MRALRRPWRPPAGAVSLLRGNNVPAPAVCAFVKEWAVSYVIAPAPEILIEAADWEDVGATSIANGGDGVNYLCQQLRSEPPGEWPAVVMAVDLGGQATQRLLQALENAG